MNWIFRGKVIEDDHSSEIGNWVYGDLSHYQRQGKVSIMDSSNDYFEVDSKTVGLWTGLTDKNGVKIFEESRVKSIWNNTRGVVKFGTFHGMYEDTYTDLQHGFYVIDDNGDTGNIFGANGEIWFEIIEKVLL